MCNRETSNADPSEETPLLSKALRPKPLSNVKMIQRWSLTKFEFTIGSLLHSPSSALPPLEITHWLTFILNPITDNISVFNDIKSTKDSISGKVWLSVFSDTKSTRDFISGKVWLTWTLAWTPSSPVCPQSPWTMNLVSLSQEMHDNINTKQIFVQSRFDTV